VDVIEALLKGGANPHVCDWKGATPVSCVKKGGKPEPVRPGDKQRALDLLEEYGKENKAMKAAKSENLRQKGACVEHRFNSPT
jgi:hypothetical protein